MDSRRYGSRSHNFTHRHRTMITTGFGIGMFIYGMTCILIGAIIAYYIINKVQKTEEQLEQEENEKYLKELRGKL